MKARLLADWLARRGRELRVVDLRVPNPRAPRVSAIVERVRAELGGPETQTVLFGASLGGLVAALVAAGEPRVVGQVLFAPLLESRGTLGVHPLTMGVARALGWVPVLDRESSRPSSVDAGLFDELGTIGSAPPLIPATLLIHGSGDRIVPVGSSRSAASQNPSIHYIEVPDDHQLVAALPELLPAVLAFLSRVWPGSDPEGAASAPAQR